MQEMHGDMATSLCQINRAQVLQSANRRLFGRQGARGLDHRTRDNVRVFDLQELLWLSE
jgi:hypothetical protein